MKVYQTFFKKNFLASVYLLLASFSTSNAGFMRKSIAPYNQFSYAHETEIVFNQERGFELDPKIEAFAKKTNHYLNSSLYFQTDFITDTKKVRNFHLKEKPYQGQTGKLFQVATEDNVTISGTFFDRGSNRLMIIGSGFTNQREKMTSFIDMFPDHDIVLFDFRGHDYKEFNFFKPKTWPSGLSELILGVNPGLVTLGIHEEKDVIAVVDYFKQTKKYTSVNGLGICYGAFNLLKAACVKPDLFNKLILDGCWLSLSLFVEKVKKDPKLMISPQKGGWSNKWPFSNKRIMGIFEFLLNKVMGLRYDRDITITDYLAQLNPNIPLLLFYGKDDLVINRKEFETIWQALPSKEKMAVLTSNPHVINHLKQKELYKLICDLFLGNKQHKVASLISDSKELAHHYAEKLYS